MELRSERKGEGEVGREVRIEGGGECVGSCWSMVVCMYSVSKECSVLLVCLTPDCMYSMCIYGGRRGVVWVCADVCVCGCVWMCGCMVWVFGTGGCTRMCGHWSKGPQYFLMTVSLHCNIF